MAAATESGAGTPGSEDKRNMAVDNVLLHIVIALGVIALAAHKASSR